MDFEQADALNQAIRRIGLKHRARAGALLGELGLYPGQEILLLDLAAHGPRTQVELADNAGCEPPSITLMVRKLEAAGLVSRRPAHYDARAVVVDLTPAGRALLPELRKVWRELAEQTLARFSAVTFDDLMAVLDDLARSLQSDDP